MSSPQSEARLEGRYLNKVTPDYKSSSSVNSVFAVLDQEPMGIIAYLSTELIVSVEEQMTCSHVKRRFSELPTLIAEYQQIYEHNFLETFQSTIKLDNDLNDNLPTYLNSSSILSLYEDSMRYISNKLNTSYVEKMGKKILRVNGFIPSQTLDLDATGVNGVGVYVLGKMEISANKKFEYLPVKIDQAEDGWIVSFELSAGEICLESFVKLFILSHCEKNEFVFSSCRGKDCLSVSDYNWHRCKKKELLTLDLKVLSEGIGKNGGRIGRKHL